MSDTAPQPPARRLAAAACLGLATALTLVVGSASATSHTVLVVDYAFQPSTLTVVAGDDVRWENQSDQAHTVTADDGSFDSGPFVRDEPFSIVFETAGTFAYHCKLHPDTMKATIVVEPAPPTPVSSGTPRPTPPPGTLPPNFSPFPSTGPIETSAPATNAPTATPTPESTSNAEGDSAPVLALLVLVLVGLGVLGLGLLWRRLVNRRP